MRLELHDAEQQPAADHPLSGVRVIVDGDLRQGETTDGLTFGLVVSNVGTTRVTLQRPDDGILLRVIDSNDRPVPIVMPLPAALVNTKDRPDPFAATEVIRLEQGETYKTTFLIRTVRVGSEQSRSAARIGLR